MSDHEHPIAAPATALVRSALAVIRCSGAGSIDLIDPLFHGEGCLREAPSHSIHHGEIREEDGEVLDDVMVSVLRAPSTFTGEDSVEIYAHGSPAGVRRILAALYRAGFSPAAPGEFSRRAFLNGKMDLTQAEAINDIVNAQTVHAHKLALNRLSGGIQEEAEAVRRQLVSIMASLAVQLDYPEEDTGNVSVDRGSLDDVTARVVRLCNSYRSGVLFQEGITVAITGRTNAGKSSLFNALLKRERSIVSDIAGTTRDYVEGTIDVGGIPVRLFDTAGQRARAATVSSIESEGIRRSDAVVSAADFVLYVVDGTEGLSEEDSERINEVSQQQPVIVVWNKIDLTDEAPPDNAVGVCSLSGEGLPELNERLISSVSAGTELEASTTIDSERQYHLLSRIADSLNLVRRSLDDGAPADAVAVDLQDAIDAVGELTGAVSSDEVLDAVFSSFCLGK